MRVLLTGSAGFVGRHLHRALDARGDDVTTCDLVDGQDALDLFRTDDTRYDLVFHCAAIVGGRASIDGSPLGVATNLALDAWYMRWLVRTKTPHAVYFSSSAAYPTYLQRSNLGWRLNEDDIGLSEYDSIHLPDQSYGWAKLTGEYLTRYVEAEGIRVHTLRPFSGYGEDQALDYPFPSFIDRAKRRADPFHIWGDGTQTRDWIHIDDMVGATLAVVDQDVTEPVNLGWGRATTFNDLADLVTTAAGYTPRIEHLTAQPSGVNYRVSNPARMHNLYPPRITLEEGISRALRN